MATTSISITPQFGNNSVVEINCGTSTPRLGGTIDISAFPSLTSFRCNFNDISAISGYANNSNLRSIQFSDNKVTGSIPSLSALINLTEFRCDRNQLSGTIPALSSLTNLRDFAVQSNRLTGPLPSLSGLNLMTFQVQNQTGPTKLTGPIPSLNEFTNMTDFVCDRNNFTGSIPVLSGLSALDTFTCFQNFLTGSIPSLNGLPALKSFQVHQQLEATKLTGSIPTLSGLPNLQIFYCQGNQLTGFGGGSVSNTLGDFQAQDNQLTQSSIDSILSAFSLTTRVTGTRILFLAGTNNAAPSYTGGVTTVSAGNLFTTLGTVVTAQCTNHGHPNNSLVTLSGNGGFQSVFTGTFQISAINANQFRYTVSTNSPTLVTGTGQVAMRRTTNATDGFRFYQNLTLVSRRGTRSPVLTGFPWNVSIKFP